jgi:tetratricopeptide (TPR) repeat protein
MNTPSHVPGDADRLVAMAAARLQAGDAPQACHLAVQALRLRKGHPGATQIGAAAMNYLRMHGEARELLTPLREQMDRNPGLLYEWVYALTHQGHPDEALPGIDRLEQLAPGRVEVQTLRGVAHAIAGRHDVAIQTLTPLVGKAAPHTVIHRLANSLWRVGRGPEGVELLTRTLELPGLPLPARRTMLFARADILDGLGEYERAWADLLAARENPETAGYDPDRVTASIDGVIASWTRERIAGTPLAAKESPRAIFVLGMWRSGTTLVQQVLASHPRVASAGELSVFQQAAGRGWPNGRVGGVPLLGEPTGVTAELVSMASAVHARALGQTSMDATRVIDKLPMNMLYLGLIARTCPGARVIRCVRDPVDTCLSCMFQLRGALAPYCEKPEWLGRFYRDACRLDEHWASVLDLPRTRVVYEKHVAEPESHARLLCEFAGLEWDDRMLRHDKQQKVAMTRSIDQVRKPVYTSAVARWRNYERHIGPLVEALGQPPGHGPASG